LNQQQTWGTHELYSASINSHPRLNSAPECHGPPIPAWGIYSQTYPQNHSAPTNRPAQNQSFISGNHRPPPTHTWDGTYLRVLANPSPTLKSPLVLGSNGHPVSAGCAQLANGSQAPNDSKALDSSNKDVDTFDQFQKCFNHSSTANNPKELTGSNSHTLPSHPTRSGSAKISNSKQAPMEPPTPKPRTGGQRASYFFKSPDTPCGNCDATTHRLDRCLGPLVDGMLPGCPHHNTKFHDIECVLAYGSISCTFLPSKPAQSNDPPFRLLLI
jgi:hypothetical protein